MWEALFWYVDIKIHHLIREKSVSHIRILPLYERNNTVRENEKIGKRFNWKRPTVEIEENTLILTCFPWRAYCKTLCSVVAYLFCNTSTFMSSYLLYSSKLSNDFEFYTANWFKIFSPARYSSPWKGWSFITTTRWSYWTGMRGGFFVEIRGIPLKKSCSTL